MHLTRPRQAYSDSVAEGRLVEEVKRLRPRTELAAVAAKGAESDESSMVYELTSIVCHEGQGMDRGHWTAACKEDVRDDGMSRCLARWLCVALMQRGGRLVVPLRRLQGDPVNCRSGAQLPSQPAVLLQAVRLGKAWAVADVRRRRVGAQAPRCCRVAGCALRCPQVSSKGPGIACKELSV